MLHQKEVAPIFDKYFVMVTLITEESKEKKHLENAGADKIKAQIGGANQGLPYFGFFDAKGTLIVNSILPAADGRKAGNVGCPYEDFEIAGFLDMLKKAAPRMSESERIIVKTGFESLKKNAKPPASPR